MKKVNLDLEKRKPSLASHLPLDFPFSLNIETSNACNLDCFFCPRKKSSKGIGLMDYALFMKIIDECAEHMPPPPLKTINLHKDGEPLTDPRIIDMIHYIAAKGAAKRFGFTSNGILLTEERGRKLLDAGLNQISFSIDSVSEESYRRVKGRDKYTIVEKNVQKFLEIKPTHVAVAVKFIRMNENMGEEQAFVDKWKGYDVDIIISEYHDWSGSVRNSSLGSVLPVLGSACENPFYSLAINWNGTVSICCVDWDSQAVVGDLSNQSLADVWNGEQLRRIRELHLSGRASSVGPCTRCTYKSPENREHIGGWLMQHHDRIMNY